MRFDAILELHGHTATGIEVPPDIVTALGSGRRPKVKVTLRDHTYRTSIGSMGGRYLLPVSSDVRAKAGVATGDALDVEIELDDEPRTVAVPDDLAEVLDREPGTRAAFDRLSHSAQVRCVSSIESAQTAETRQRRIGSTVRDLLAQAPAE